VDIEALSTLKYGTIGLCAILTFFAFQLLSKEQKTNKPHPRNHLPHPTLHGLAVTSKTFGLCSQLPLFRPARFGCVLLLGFWEVRLLLVEKAS
jgi:hypothetical protein